MTTCAACNAPLALPADLAAVTLTCAYCGKTQPVPGMLERHRLLLEQTREARLLEQHRADVARDQAEAVTAARRDRQASRRSRWTWLRGLVPLLLAPTIIAVVVFDAPARLGFGDAGEARLRLAIAPLRAAGCAERTPMDDLYASSPVVRAITVNAGACVHVLAAGGPHHDRLRIRLLDGTGAELAKTELTSDPQLQSCPRPGALRFVVDVAPAAKGRLSLAAFTCPPATPTAHPR